MRSFPASLVTTKNHFILSLTSHETHACDCPWIQFPVQFMLPGSWALEAHVLLQKSPSLKGRRVSPRGPVRHPPLALHQHLLQDSHHWVLDLWKSVSPAMPLSKASFLQNSLRRLDWLTGRGGYVSALRGLWALPVQPSGHREVQRGLPGSSVGLRAPCNLVLPA